MFRFRPLTSDDFPLLLAWLSQAYIKEWWDDGDDTLEKVADHYGRQDETSRFLLVTTEDGEKPIGYFQHYPWDDGWIGIDQFIGDESLINKGVGTQAIELFVEMIMLQHEPPAIFLDPDPNNKRAIRCYEKAGFVHYETKTTEAGTAAYMMRFEPGRLAE
jgi:RimJ/RimL family protein N-acetyltransferase